MRLELALIVGIIFFCSWCAYIVARMNSSVAPPPPPAHQSLAAGLQTGGAGQSEPTLSVAPEHSGRAWTASSGEAASLAQPWAPWASVPRAPAGHEQTHAGAPSNRWPQLVYAPAAVELPVDEQPQQEHQDHQDHQEHQDRQEHQDQQEQHEQQDDDELAGAAPDEEQSDDESEQQPDEGSKVDEVAKRSSFSELVDDERERDRNGRLVVQRRRHLLNGRPVSAPELDRSGDNDDDNDDEERVDDAHTKTDEPGDAQRERERDFDRLVDEIERERERRAKRPSQRPMKRDSARRAATGARDELTSGTTRAGLLAPASNKSSAKARKSVPGLTDEPKELHEHSVHEKLEQRQWDDDSMMVGDGERRARDQRRHAAANGANDEEARRLEALANDLTFGPAQQLDRRRRKRAVADESTLHSNASDAREPAGGVLKPPSTGATGAAGQHLSGQEDLQVEVLAAPPSAQLAPNQQLDEPTGGPVLVVTAPQQTRVASDSRQNLRSAVKKIKRKKNKTKKKQKRMKKKSTASSSKHKAAKAYEHKRNSKKKKRAQVAKRKRKSERQYLAGDKYFRGATRGKKLAAGKGHKGAHIGKQYFKDKGYKKRGFKKSYHKLETGDHKTYFDEFRDKDHDSKWKKYNDKHKYSQSKKWAGSDMKRAKKHKLAEARAKAIKQGHWNERSKSVHTKKGHKLDKSHKELKLDGENKKKKKLEH